MRFVYEHAVDTELFKGYDVVLSALIVQLIELGLK